jgi:hypothetical protein
VRRPLRSHLTSWRCPPVLPLYRQRELELEAAEEEALAARVEATVQARVAAALESPEFAARVVARLTEERARLEERVSRQLGVERAQLLERKRREDAERRRQEEEMGRILEDNRKKVQRGGWVGEGWVSACAGLCR